MAKAKPYAKLSAKEKREQWRADAKLPTSRCEACGVELPERDLDAHLTRCPALAL